MFEKKSSHWIGVKSRRQMTYAKELLIVIMMFLVSLLCACSVVAKHREKVREIDYTVVAREELPELLQSQIDAQKESDMQMSYNDGEFMYIVRGYGKQEKAGYSISVEDLYMSEDCIVFDTLLLGPKGEDDGEKKETMPYVVVKLEALDLPVVYE